MHQVLIVCTDKRVEYIYDSLLCNPFQSLFISYSSFAAPAINPEEVSGVNSYNPVHPEDQTPDTDMSTRGDRSGKPQTMPHWTPIHHT